ncbi:hypothetical protein BDR07DRAFT_1379591 [Suillus spraguei]|nr:hypothetical protein BDR07DRAFT_1379591 [Suillus spraguei]
MSQDDIDNFIYETSDNNEPAAPNLNFMKLSSEHRTTLLWARKKMVQKMLLEGWLPQTTGAEKEDLKNCARTCVREGNDKFGSDIALTDEVLEFVVEFLMQKRRTLATQGETYIKDYGIETSISKEDQQIFLKRRRDERYDSSDLFNHFLHGFKINEDAGTPTVMMFANPVVVDTHINHFYCDPNSPLWDDTLRPQVTTTPIPGLAVTVAAASNMLFSIPSLICLVFRQNMLLITRSKDTPQGSSRSYASTQTPSPATSALKRNTTPAPSRPMHPQPPPHKFQLEGPSSDTCYPQQGMATDELLNQQMGLAY